MDRDFLADIIASPRDVSLRQAYARALRDSDDLRGAYLESEIAWAATRQPADLRALRDFAAPLDPVWVARVSRPPMGVCCDRIHFLDGADRLRPRVRDQDLDWLQARFHVTLPADYRAFLLNYNGGIPDPNYLRLTPEQRDAGCNDLVALFCSIWAARESDIDWDMDLVWSLQFLDEEVQQSRKSLQELPYPWQREMAERWRATPHADWMIIGSGAPSGEQEWFCLECRGPDPRKVFCVDPESLHEPDHCFVAPSFADFLELFTDQEHRDDS